MADQIRIISVLSSMKNSIIKHSGLCYFKSALEYHKELIHSIIIREKSKSSVTSAITFAQAGKQCIEMMTEEFRFNNDKRDLILISVSELEANNTCVNSYSQEFVDLLVSVKPELIINS